MTESGETNVLFKFAVNAGWNTLDFDLTQPGLFGPSLWAGKIIRLELAVGGSHLGGDRFTHAARLGAAAPRRCADDAAERPDRAGRQPERGRWRRLRHRRGNPWDFGGSDDILTSGNLRSTASPTGT